MSMIQRLEELLGRHEAVYGCSVHPRANTAVSLAAAGHVPPAQQAKVVLLEVDGQNVMVVTSAASRVSEPLVREAMNASCVRVLREDEVVRLCPDCEAGAMPPFGSLYGIPVWLDEELSRQPFMTFNAGTHKDAVRMSMDEYRDLVMPQIADLSYRVF